MKFVLAILFFPFLSLAQEAKYIHPTLLGPRFGLLQFKQHKSFTNFNRLDAGVGMHFIKGLSTRIDWQLSVDGSFADSASKQKLDSKSLLLQSDVGLRLRMFRPVNKIQPFVSAGIGIQSYRQHMGLYFPLGIGIQWNLFKEIYLISQTQWRPTAPVNINQHIFYSIGFSGKLIGGGKRKLPKPKIETTILIAGPAPDTDKDGIVDSTDLCPQAAGMAIFNGCPDTDNDGIPDKDDGCPLLFGVDALKGCPNPDSDGDGLHNSADSCVNQPGPAENYGCPIDTPKVSKRLAIVAKFIQFETASANLNKESFQYLDTVVEILFENPGIRLLIEGHTDSTSTVGFNNTLSEKRAKTVVDYLVAKGVEVSRLQYKGWGPSKPIADNNSKQGRAINRRVELIVKE